MTHIHNPAATPMLTHREWQVLRLVAAGRSDKEIARHLSVSQFTVRKHLEHIFAKLDVHSRTAAVARVAQVAIPEVPTAHRAS